VRVQPIDDRVDVDAPEDESGVATGEGRDSSELQMDDARAPIFAKMGADVSPIIESIQRREMSRETEFRNIRNRRQPLGSHGRASGRDLESGVRVVRL
jgi:hypothetical protein